MKKCLKRKYFLGSAVCILGIALLTIRWIGPHSAGQLWGIGLLWLVLMLGFEFSFGRFYLRLPWSRLLADFDLREGGLLGFGMVFLALSPGIAAWLTGVSPTFSP